ncbi:MAG: Crp/Fnr family transcriptional regulator [Bryobacterales bacterium]|nr:Crp/Fnr family transcriptional regulator [Bryobacterales bacterium]
MKPKSWSDVMQWNDPLARARIRDWRRFLPFGPSSLRKAGTRLMHHSSPVTSVFLIETGIVKLTRINSDDREITLMLRFPGDLVGHYGALLHLPHFVAATAATDCHIAEIAAKRTVEVFQNNTEAACFLANHQTIEAARTTALLMDARSFTAEQRFFRLLLELALVTGTPRSVRAVRVRAPLSEAEMADLLGISKTSLSRLKRTAIRAGRLRQEGGVFSFDAKLAPK